ncbi:MAG: glutaredoxin family protein [Phycisphaerales bacterium]
MADLLFYTKQECPLCDRLKAMLREATRDRADLDLREIDIETDPGLIEQFRFRVPVVVWDDEAILEGRPEQDEVNGVIARLPKPPLP